MWFVVSCSESYKVLELDDQVAMAPDLRAPASDHIVPKICTLNTDWKRAMPSVSNQMTTMHGATVSLGTARV